MDNFLKWVKNTFATNLPNDYLQFLLSDDKNSIVGKIFQSYENEKLTATDIHYIFEMGGNLICLSMSVEKIFSNLFCFT